MDRVDGVEVFWEPGGRGQRERERIGVGGEAGREREGDSSSGG
jgi:hypothetical protein